MSRAATLPDIVQRRARMDGPVGLAWVAGLDALIAEIERDWSVTVGPALAGGSEAYVAEARTAAGEAAILKLALPSSSPLALQVLAAAGGRGYARVLRHDEGRRAVLMERLGVQLGELNLACARQIEILCATLREAWMAPPPGLSPPTGADKAAALRSFIDDCYRDLGGPCSARTVALARDYAAQRIAAFDPAAAVLAHGDCHQWNALMVPGSSPPRFKFVDPEGLFIERAYDVGIMLREWPQDILAGEPYARGQARCAFLARLAGLEARALWQWGFLERVATGMMLLKIGETAEGRQCLAIADIWAAAA